MPKGLLSDARAFDARYAIALGLNESIVLQQVSFWLNYYQDDPDHQHDGHTWVWNPVAQPDNPKKHSWEKNFPWWSLNTVRRAFASLEKQGVLVAGNYNRMSRDRTKWHRVDHIRLEQVLSDAFTQTGEVEIPLTQNGEMSSTQIGEVQLPDVGTPLPETTNRENTETTTTSAPSEPPPFLIAEHKEGLVTFCGGRLSGDFSELYRVFTQAFDQNEVKGLHMGTSIVFKHLMKEQEVWHSSRRARGDVTQALKTYITKRYSKDLEFSRFDAQYCTLMHHLGLSEVRAQETLKRKHLSNALAMIYSVLEVEGLTFKQYAAYCRHLFDHNQLLELNMSTALNIDLANSFASNWSNGQVSGEAVSAVRMAT